MSAPAWSPAALDYLVAHAIEPAVATRAGVRDDGDAVRFPWPTTDGRSSWRRRTLGADGCWRGEAGAEPGVWWPLSPPTADLAMVFVAEGGPDALAACSAIAAGGEAGVLLERELAGVAAVPSASFPPDRLVAAVTACGARAAVLAFDGDEAGRRATARLGAALTAAGVHVRALELPDGQDVADVLARQGRDGAAWLADAVLDAAAVGRGSSEEAEDGGGLYRLMTGAELLDLPEPAWLLDGLLPAGGLTVLYGPSGVGKSFLALDWALSVAAGLPWHGRAVQMRPVVFVAAEGLAGLGLRYRAWLVSRGLSEVPGIRFLADAVNLLDGVQVDRARRTLASLPDGAGLLVIDTLARAMVGGDENHARDVGRFVEAVDSLRGQGAALVVHHTGHEGERERGSSALGAAADARLQLLRDGRTPRLTLTNLKQKDAEESEPVALRLEPTAGSLVVEVVATVQAAEEAQEAADALREAVYAFVVTAEHVSKREVRANVRAGNPRVDHALEELLEAGRITTKGKGRGAGYVPCPDPPGTLGHGPVPSSGGTVPGQGEDPEGVPTSGTVRDLAIKIVPEAPRHDDLDGRDLQVGRAS